MVLLTKVALLVAYDGTPYRGWNDVRDTVLRPTLARILRADVTLDAASRTDAGVHALGQVTPFGRPLNARTARPLTPTHDWSTLWAT